MTTKTEIIEFMKDRATALEIRAERLSGDHETKMQLEFAAQYMRSTISTIRRTVKDLKPVVDTVETFIYVTEFSRAKIPTKEQLNEAIDFYSIDSENLIADIYGYFLY